MCTYYRPAAFKFPGVTLFIELCYLMKSGFVSVFKKWKIACCVKFVATVKLPLGATMHRFINIKPVSDFENQVW